MHTFTENRKVTLWLSFGILVLALIAAGLLWARSGQSPGALTRAATRASFPLYEPAQLPKDYKLEEPSLSLTSQALLFTARDSKDNVLIFTQTPVPSDFDFESFYKTRFVGIQDAQSIFGRGKVGILDGSLTGSLVTDSTWVLIKGPEEMSANNMIQIISSLKPIR